MYSISFFKSTYEAWVAEDCEVDLETLGQLLTTDFNITNDKSSVMMFSMTKFKTLEEGAINGQVNHKPVAGTRRRCRENAISISGLILDYDGYRTIEEVKTRYAGLYMIIYTTYSHSPEKSKFRVIMPFNKPLSVADFEARRTDMADFFEGADGASFSLSQSFYLPSSSPQNQHLIETAIIEGELLDPMGFKAEELADHTNLTYKTSDDQAFSDDYARAVFDALNSCSNMHYRGDRNRNDGVLTLVSICRSIGLTFEEYDQLCQRICAPDSSLTNASTRQNAWNDWNSNKITRDKRDAFIKANGGNSIRKINNDNKLAKVDKDIERLIRRIKSK